MFYVPEKLTGIHHPSVDSMYLKKDSQHPLSPDIIVIEARNKADMQGVLDDLDVLTRAAEAKAGPIGEVDIRA